eukprot:TRINITY_DN16_c0_g4_i1.p1 TRINITY_DN16_c0_g4~~TRINITY_DN16_c0_g4_i1.p1  ORF type:complete len:394 (-),score=117.50 TRINITY_DN16_c0_g4_i1:197-1378(-)
MDKQDISCPICGETFLDGATELQINQHIDWCLTQVYLREEAAGSAPPPQPAQQKPQSQPQPQPQAQPQPTAATTSTSSSTVQSNANTSSSNLFARAMTSNDAQNTNTNINTNNNRNNDYLDFAWNSDESEEEQPEEEEPMDEEEAEGEEEEEEEDEDEDQDSDDEEDVGFVSDDNPFVVACPYHKAKYPHHVCGKRMEARCFPAHVFRKHRESLSHAYPCPICLLFNDVRYKVNKNTNLLSHLENSHYVLKSQHTQQQQQHHHHHQHKSSHRGGNHSNKYHNRHYHNNQRHHHQHNQQHSSTQSIPQQIPIKPKPALILRASSLELNPPGSDYAYAKQYITDPMVGVECSICYEEFQPEEIVARMECLCVYHVACIERWFKVKEKQCPLHTST